MSDMQIVVSANVEQVAAGFQRIEQSVRAARVPINQLGKDGSDTAALLQKIGEVGSGALSQFARSAEAAAMPVDQLKSKLREMNNEVGRQGKEGAKAAAEHAAALMVAANQVNELAAKMRELSGEFAEAAREQAKLTRNIAEGFGKANAGPIVDQIEELGIKFGVNEEQATQAAKALQKYGQFGKESFEDVIHAARETGTSIEAAAEAFGKFEKFKDARSARAFKGAFGIDPEEMAAQMGMIDDAGKIFFKTQEEAERFGEALHKALAEKGKNAAQVQQGAAAQLRGELQQLKEEIGAGLVEKQNRLAESIMPVVKGMREWSAETKAYIGIGTQLAATMGTGLGTALQWGASLSLMGVNMKSIGKLFGETGQGVKALSTAFLGMSGTMLGIVAVGGGLIAFALEYKKATEDLWAAESKLLEIESRRAQLGARNADVIGKSADQIRAMGKTAKDVANEIEGLHDRLEQANKVGDTKTAQQLVEWIKQLQAAKAQLAQGDTKQKEETDKAAEAQKKHSEEAMEQVEELDRKRKSGAYESKQAELAATDDVLRKYTENNRLKTVAELEQQGLTYHSAVDLHKKLKGLSDDRTKLAREAAGERVKEEVNAVEQEVAAGKLSASEAAKRYRELSQTAGLAAQERKSLELKAIEEDKKAREQSLALELHDLEQRRKNHSLTADQETTSLRQILATHQLTVEQRMQLENKLTEVTAQAVQERQNHELKSFQKRQAAGEATIQDEIAMLEKLAKDPDLSPEQRDERELQAAQKKKELKDHAIAQEKELAKIQADRISREEASIQEDVAKGEAGAMDKKVELIKKRYDIERKEILQTQAEEDKKFKRTQDATDVLNAKLGDLQQKEQDEVRKTGEDRISYLRKLVDEWQKWKDKQEGKSTFKGGGQSIQDAFSGGSNFGFSLSGGSALGGGAGAPKMPGGVDPTALEAMLNNPDLDPNDPRIAAVYNQATSQNKPGAGTNLGKMTGAGGATVGTDANGNRILIPATGGSVAGAGGAVPTAAGTPGGPAIAPGAMPSTSPAPGGGGIPGSVQSLTINAQNVTVNGAGTSGGATSSGSTSNSLQQPAGPTLSPGNGFMDSLGSFLSH